MNVAQGRALLRNHLLLVLALNLFLLALLLWASLDTLTVRLQVTGSQLTAIINGYQVTAQDTRYPSGGGALLLGDERSYRNYVSPPAPSGAVARLLTGLWTWDLASNPSSGWKDIRVEGQTTQGRLFRFEGLRFMAEAGWRPVFPGAYHPLGLTFATFGDLGWQDYTIEARLLRGREDASLLVRSPSPGTGYLFWFRPEHGDMAWQVWRDGHQVESLVVGGFRLPLLTGVKAVLRELLWSYFHGLALVALILAVAIPLGALTQGVVRHLRSTSKAVWRGIHPHTLRIWGPSALAILVGLLAFAATTTIAITLYDRIPHVQDSVTYLFQAQTFARGRTTAPAPPLPEFFHQEFIVVKDGQWFGKYPPGHPLVLALGVLAGVPWLVGPIAGSLALGAIYLAASAMYSRGTGLMAITLGLLSPFVLFLAASFMAHPTELLFLSLFLLAFVKAHQRGSPAWALATGLFWGLALMTRSLSAVAFGLPFALYALGSLVHQPRDGLRLYGGMVLGALAPVLFLLWYNWALTGSPVTQTYTLYWDFDRLGFGEGVGAVLGSHTPEAGLMNTWRNTTILLVHLYGWLPYMSLAFVCLPFALLKANRWDLLLLGAALSTMAAYVFYWADGIMFGPRYYYGALPALLLLTARGIQVAATTGGATAPRARRLIQGGLATAVVGLLVLGNLVVYLPGQLPIYNGYNYTSGEPLARVKETGLTKALVFVEDDPNWQWWRYGALFIGNTPWLDGEVIHARDLGPEENRRLMAAYPARKAYVFDGVGVRAVK